jgi:hypothetical protein
VLVIGQRDQISFELESRPQNGLLQVEIWCAGLHATYFDNHVHTPSFKHSMQRELERLQTEKLQSKQPVLRLGPTTDDASSSIKVKGSVAHLETNLSNGKKGNATIPLADLLNIYSNVIAQLEVTASA